MNRRGQTIPLVVLVLMLLATLGYTVIWQGSSQASQTGQTQANTQGAVAAQSGLEESIAALQQMFQQDLSGGAGPNGPWRSQLLAKFDKARTFSGDSTDPKAYSSINLQVDISGQLAATQQAVQNLGGKIDVAQAVFHDFRPVVYPVDETFHAAAGSKAGAYYSEPQMGDGNGNQDPTPLDFQGYVTTTVRIEIPGYYGMVGTSMAITRDVKVVDTTPPAREFALFSYGPPPNEQYIANDLNTGGTMAVFPNNASRVLVRGPLFLKTEDAGPAQQPEWGGEQRTNASLSYPNPDQAWDGWSFIPGPRAVHWPNLSTNADNIVATVEKLFAGQGLSALAQDPIRPDKKWGPVAMVGTMPNTGLIPGLRGMTTFKQINTVLGGRIGLWVRIPKLTEKISQAESFAYIAGSVPAGTQKFSVIGVTSNQPSDPMAQKFPSLFKGLVQDSGGKALGEFDPSTASGGLNGLSVAAGTTVDDGQMVRPEPVYYSTDGSAQDSGAAPGDHGVYGVYKIVTFSRNVLFSIDIVDQILRPLSLIPFFAPVLGPIYGAAKTYCVTLFQVIPFSTGYWSVGAAPNLATTDLTAMTDKDWADYYIAPWCLYFETKHNSPLLDEVIGDAALLASAAIMAKGFSMVSAKLFPKVPTQGQATQGTVEQTVQTKLDDPAAAWNKPGSDSTLVAPGNETPPANGQTTLDNFPSDSSAGAGSKDLVPGSGDSASAVDPAVAKVAQTGEPPVVGASNLRAEAGTEPTVQGKASTLTIGKKTFFWGSYTDPSKPGVFDPAINVLKSAGGAAKSAATGAVSAVAGTAGKAASTLAVAAASVITGLTRFGSAAAGPVAAALGFGALNVIVTHLQESNLRAQLKAQAQAQVGGPPSVADILHDFPRGLFPPKYRPYYRVATRVYKTFDDFVAAQGAMGGGKIALDNVVLIQGGFHYDHPDQTFTYSGRGIIVGLGSDGDKPILSANFVRADDQSYLTLVYENMATQDSNTPSVLTLGTTFQGSVYASQGVCPKAGATTNIIGNLVCFNMNKSQISEGSGVNVVYDSKHLPPAVDAGQGQGSDPTSPGPWWIVAISSQAAAVADPTH